MTWTDLDPYPSPGGTIRLHGVMISASKGEGRYRPSLILTIRPRLFEGGAPSWLAAGTKVNVQLGSGADAGLLRLTPNGRFLLGRTPKGTDCCTVRLPVLPHQQLGKQRPVACEFDWHDTWVSITLPAWCRAKPAIPQPALSPEAEARLARRAA